MRTKELLLFLGLQILAIAVAGLSFSLIESRLVAGAVAGLYFITSGLFMVGRTYGYPGKWRLLYWYPLLVHVFVISIPMVVTRFLNAGEAFVNVRILGLEGPVFHRLSTTILSIFMGATLIDIARAYRRERGASNEPPRTV